MSVLPLYSKYVQLISKFAGASSRKRDLTHTVPLQNKINTVIPALTPEGGCAHWRKAGIHYVLLISILFILIACDNTGEPIVPEPGDVKMVEHSVSDDTLATERGIDAVPESDGIYLAWYSLRDPNISRYNIYRKKSDGSFFQRIKSIDLETASAGRDTTFVDDNAEAGLALNTYYYYFVTATNTDGQEGTAVDTLRYMLIDKPVLDRPDGESYHADVDSLPVLFWNFVEIPDLYILRIENSFDQVHYIGIFQSNYDNNYQTKELSSIPDLPAFIPGVYKWRIDSIGPDEDHSGAESDWKVFIII